MEIFMKRARRITYALMSFAMLFATTAFAANKGSLHIQSTTMAGKTQLPAGEYTVQWEGAGPDVELKIKLHNRVKGTVPAKVIPLDQSFEKMRQYWTPTAAKAGGSLRSDSQARSSSSKSNRITL